MCTLLVQAEILAQESSYEALKAQGASLIGRGHEDTQAVQAQLLLDKLSSEWTTLLDTWQQRMNLLNQCKNYLVSYVYSNCVMFHLSVCTCVSMLLLLASTNISKF